LDLSEIIDFADINAGVLATAPGRLNPYKLGLELFRDVEDRWNKGKFGKEYDDCDNLEEKLSWDRELGQGKEQIFRVRKLYNDVSFIDEFLTEEFVAEHQMYSFGYNRKSGHWEIDSRQFQDVKDKLLDQLTNFGNPFIYVKDGNFKNRAELLLHHKHMGVDLDMQYGRGVLRALHRVWKRPVNIETLSDDKGVLLSYDGKEFTETSIEYHPI
jgi:stage V sporulation protein R